MKKMRIAALTLALAMLTGAAAFAESTQSPESSPRQAGTFGKVTLIDGNTITIALAEMGDGQGGNPPSDGAEQPSGEAPEGTPPADSTAQPSGEAPEGGSQPSGDRAGGGFNMTFSDETLTFTVDDATVITIRGGQDAQDTTGTLADLAVDALVSVEMGDNNIATAVAVMSIPTAAPDAAEATATTES